MSAKWKEKMCHAFCFVLAKRQNPGSNIYELLELEQMS